MLIEPLLSFQSSGGNNVLKRHLTTGKSNNTPSKSAREPKAILALFAKGFCMGASDVVPGVSGGTMALILGIYEELIQSIKALDLAFLRLVLRGRFSRALDKAPFGFLLPLGLGILTAIFTMARGLSWLLNEYPVVIWSFFFGLVLASAFVVGCRIEKWEWTTVLGIVISALAAYFLVGLVPIHTPEALPFIYLCGAVAICAMILPGISGSFILVLLGKYHFVLDAVGRLDLLVLSVFTAGTATGILLFVRILNWLLKRFYQCTMAALTGLMIGSLRKIWPWKSMTEFVNNDAGSGVTLAGNMMPHQMTSEVYLAIGLALLGGLSVILLQRLAEK
jgi:putative membrane protein